LSKESKETKANIISAAGLMSVATFISRILGYVKDMILARYFGATGVSDVFFVAFRIPNLLRELFAEGSMSSAFIPVLTDCQIKEGKDAAKKLVKSVFLILFIILIILCFLGVIFAEQIILLMAPGFSSNHEKLQMTVTLTRIMLPFLLFVSLSSLVMGVLNTRGIFFIPALAPALLNIVTIICVIMLFERLTHPIISVAIGITIGGLMQFLFQLPAFYKEGYSLILPFGDFKLFNEKVKKIGKLILPSTVGMAVSQINIFVSTIFASFLKEGSITALYYSMRLIQFPIGIFGVAMSMAALPTLSKHAAEGRIDKIAEDFSFSLKILFFIAIPSMAGLISIRDPLVNLLFQRGLFDYEATRATASALMYYSIGIWAIVGIRVCTSAFYSLQDTSTPVKTATIGIITNIIFCYILITPMGHNGLALANSLSAMTNFFIIFWLIKRKISLINVMHILKSLVKIVISALTMGVVVNYFICSTIWTTSDMFLYKSLYLSASIFIAITIYGLMTYFLGSEEIRFFIKRIFSKA